MPSSVRAPADGVGRDAVETEAGEQQREAAEESREHRHDPLLRELGVHLIVERTEGDRDVTLHRRQR